MRSLPLLLAGLFVCSPVWAASPDIDFFEKNIRPVLVKHCYKCHSVNGKVQGGLLLDSRQGMRKGGDSGPAVVPKDIDASLILEAIKYESFEMPPTGKLPDEVIAHFEEWVRRGAADPRDAPQSIDSVRTKIDIEKGRQFWSFQPPQAAPSPPVKQSDWPRRGIDPFVLARLEAAGYQPAARAERRQLIRRVTYDLIGLPPTPEEVQAFVSDKSPDAYEQLVARLLDSPHYGERWARMWLDVARYAEDQAHIVGNNKTLFYPNAYLYRDWVIKAFNQDLPYNEFIRRQLAADQIDPEDKAGHAALGYLGLGPKYYGRGNLAVMADEWEDRIDVVGRGLLGITMACARCHDHKFDPIPTADYYALAGVFASTEMYNCPLDGIGEPQTEEEPKDQEKEKKKVPPEKTMHIVRDGKPQDLNVFVRGDVKSKGPVVPRHFLQVLSPGEPIKLDQGSGRQQLAEAIVDRNNPLTARVFVNRVWAQLFGRGLVRTPSNFGKLGDAPTHPQLLDDLSVRFMESGWSIKWLVRELVLSATYQQSTTASPKLLATDPENKLLGRMSRRRLSVEQWRDGLLAVTETLDPAVGGKSIDPADPKQTRRTVYSYISRLELNKLLQLFDFPDPNAHSARRVETTTPLQKMFVMNNPFMVHQAHAFAERLAREVHDDVEHPNRQRIERAYSLLYGRAPQADEVKLGLAFLESTEGNPDQRWAQYAQVLLASNETLFVD